MEKQQLWRSSKNARKDKSGADMSAICLWCGRVFLPRVTGGRKQRFCCAACRSEFHDCARRWAIAEVDAGRLTTGQLAAAPKHNINVAQADKTVPPDSHTPAKEGTYLPHIVTGPSHEAGE